MRSLHVNKDEFFFSFDWRKKTLLISLFSGIPNESHLQRLFDKRKRRFTWKRTVHPSWKGTRGFSGVADGSKITAKLLRVSAKTIRQPALIPIAEQSPKNPSYPLHHNFLSTLLFSGTHWEVLCARRILVCCIYAVDITSKQTTFVPRNGSRIAKTRCVP